MTAVNEMLRRLRARMAQRLELPEADERSDLSLEELLATYQASNDYLEEALETANASNALLVAALIEALAKLEGEPTVTLARARFEEVPRDIEWPVEEEAVKITLVDGAQLHISY